MSDITTAFIPDPAQPWVGNVPLTWIVPNPGQPRTFFDEDALRRTSESMAELLVALRAVVTLVEDDDSFEGSISYACMDDRCSRHEFMLEAAVRSGNKEGQGSMVLVNKYTEA